MPPDIKPVPIPALNFTKTITESLKVFAVLSARKELDWPAVKDKFNLLVTVAYTPGEAIDTTMQAIKASGENPEGVNVGIMMISMPLESLIGRVGVIQTTNEPTIALPPTREEKKQKSAAELIAYIQYVFEDATAEEQKVLVEVIKRFAKKNHCDERGTANIRPGDKTASAT